MCDAQVAVCWLQLQASLPHSATHLATWGRKYTGLAWTGTSRHRQKLGLDSDLNRTHIATVLLYVPNMTNIGLHFYIRFKISYVLPESHKWVKDGSMKMS